MKELEEKQKKAQQEEEIIQSNIVKDEHWNTLGIWILNNQNPDWSENQTSLQFGIKMVVSHNWLPHDRLGDFDQKCLVFRWNFISKSFKIQFEVHPSNTKLV